MSLCDSCHAPGTCCKSIWLSCYGIDHTDPQGWMSSRGDSYSKKFPFVLASVDETEKGPNRYRWACRNLTPEGRCGDYENRPYACRHYTPAEDGLCVHYWHEGGDPTAGPWGDLDYGGSGRGPGHKRREVSELQELTCPPSDCYDGVLAKGEPIDCGD